MINVELRIQSRELGLISDPPLLLQMPKGPGLGYIIKSNTYLTD